MNEAAPTPLGIDGSHIIDQHKQHSSSMAPL
jgi:hypothetical protein